MISVVLLTHNHSMYINDVLSAIISQKISEPVELVWHDDASTDNTVEALKTVQLPSNFVVKTIFRSKNSYQKVRMMPYLSAMQQCTGRIIFFCDGDDVWLTDTKLSEQMYLLDENRDCGICVTNVVRVNGDKTSPIEIKKRNLTVLSLFRSNNVYHSSFAIKKDLMENFINLDVKKNFSFHKNKRMPDYRLVLFALSNGYSLRIHPKVMLRYTVRNGSMSNSDDKRYNYNYKTEVLDIKRYYLQFLQPKKVLTNIMVKQKLFTEIVYGECDFNLLSEINTDCRKDFLRNILQFMILLRSRRLARIIILILRRFRLV